MMLCLVKALHTDIVGTIPSHTYPDYPNMTKRITPQPKKVKTSHKPPVRHDLIVQENLYTGTLKKCKPNEAKMSMDQEH